MMKVRSPLPSARNSRVLVMREGDIAVDIIWTPVNTRISMRHSNGAAVMGSISSFIDIRPYCSRHIATRSFSGRSAVEKRIVEKPSGFISVALLQDRAGIGGVSPSSHPLKEGDHFGKQ